jgi:hypothetical protein
MQDEGQGRFEGFKGFKGSPSAKATFKGFEGVFSIWFLTFKGFEGVFSIWSLFHLSLSNPNSFEIFEKNG